MKKTWAFVLSCFVLMPILTTAPAFAGTSEYSCLIKISGKVSRFDVPENSGWTKISLPGLANRVLVLSDYEGSLLIGILDETQNAWISSKSAYKASETLISNEHELAVKCSFQN